MIYKYKAISQNGEVIEGFFEGENESDVIAMLKSNNYMPINIEKDVVAEARVDLFAQKVKKKDLAVFCRQFYTMLDAGVGIVKSLEILEKQSENKTLVKAIGTLHEDVQKGFSLSEGMKKHKKIFPLLLINMVEAGEVSGNLDTIMERMAIHFEKENKLEQKIKSALMYPIILSIVSIAVIIFLLVAVMPTFISMFEGSGKALPGPTQLLLNISNWLTEYWYLFIGGVILAIVASYIFKQTPKGTFFFDSLKIKLPLIRTTNIKIVTARFTRTLSTLIASGIPLIQSIEVVGRVVGNRIIHDKLETATENIRKGITLSRAVQDLGLFPPMVDSMIKVGEESGSLDDILFKTADFYDDEVEVTLQRMTTLMEPIMLVIMALVIGFIVAAMAMPMFELMNAL